MRFPGAAVLLALAILAATARGEACAQVYPVKPVRIIVPNATSGLAELGLETAAGPPEELDRWIRAEMERWGRVIREQGITLE
jgi:tripartite-type tricarboxylate transporter receptor subunit TctC